MKKVLSLAMLALLLFALIFASSCSNGSSWKGFYDEDLSKYLDLGGYKGLSYESPIIHLTPEEVDEQIDLMLEASTELVESDDSAHSESGVKIDRYCFVNGVSSPELSSEGQTYFIDTEYEDIVLSTVVSACVGKKKGDTFNVSLTLPAGYKGIVNAESSAEFRVSVLSVYEKVTPKLTDSIAPTLIPGCNSVEELKNTVRSRMEKQLLDSAMNKIKAELKAELIESSTVKKIPVAVLNEYYDDIMTLHKRIADSLSVPLEEYAEKELGMTASELENMVLQSANERTKEALVLYSVVVAENIEVTDALLLEYAEKMALESEGIFGSGEEYMSYFGKNAVTEDYLWSRVLDLMLENASVNS